MAAANPFVNGKTQAVSGDTFFAVIEFSTPQRAEALLGYGNWSKAGSKHVEDQLPLLSRKEMRPIGVARSQGYRGQPRSPEGLLASTNGTQLARRLTASRSARSPRPEKRTMNSFAAGSPR